MIHGHVQRSGQNAYRLGSWKSASPAIWMTSSGRVTKHESQEHKGSAGEGKKDYGAYTDFF